jgi:hypothetical protein
MSQSDENCLQAEKQISSLSDISHSTSLSLDPFKRRWHVNVKCLFPALTLSESWQQSSGGLGDGDISEGC